MKVLYGTGYNRLGVCNYPQKPKKKSAPVEEVMTPLYFITRRLQCQYTRLQYSVAVIQDSQDRFLLRQREATGKCTYIPMCMCMCSYNNDIAGLLAGYWEFPSVLVRVGAGEEAGAGSEQEQQWLQLRGEIAKKDNVDGHPLLLGHFLGSVGVLLVTLGLGVCVCVCVCALLLRSPSNSHTSIITTTAGR